MPTPKPLNMHDPALPYAREEGDREDRAVELHAFDAWDRFDRQIGARVETWISTFTPTPEGAHNLGRRVAPGRYFAFRPWATRDGKAYGPIQRTAYFETEADRAAYVARYLDGARKRAAKASTR